MTTAQHNNFHDGWAQEAPWGPKVPPGDGAAGRSLPGGLMSELHFRDAFQAGPRPALPAANGLDHEVSQGSISWVKLQQVLAE